MRDGLAQSLAGPMLLVALGVARLMRLVLHDPLLGYADNFDFHRTASWYGWVPLEMGKFVVGSHPEAPLALYAITGERTTEVFSSGLIHMEIAAQAHRMLGWLGLVSPDRLDIRFVGAMRAVILSVIAAVAVWRLRSVSRRAAWSLSIVFAAIIADPLVTLFANTLYTDFDAVIFLFAAGAALVYLSLAPTPTWGVVVAVAVALGLLGLSKLQHALLPMVLVAVTAACGSWRLARGTIRERLAALLIGGAVVVPATVQLVVLSGDGPVVSASRTNNAANTWFSAVLPAFREPKRIVTELGLPAVCERNIGRSWYDPEAEVRACRGVGHVSRFRVVPLLAQEPGALMRLVDGASRHAASWTHDGLGQVEGRRMGRIEHLGDPSLRSLAALPRLLGPDRHAVWMNAMLVVFVLCLGTALIRPFLRAGPASQAALGASLCSAVVLYALASSVLGDGYVELTKHFLLGRIALVPALLMSVAWAREAIVESTNVRSDRG